MCSMQTQLLWEHNFIFSNQELTVRDEYDNVNNNFDFQLERDKKDLKERDGVEVGKQEA